MIKISQDDIIKMLEKKKEPLTSKELSEYLKIRQDNIIRTLRKLVKQKAVKSRPLTKKELSEKGYEHKGINSRFKIFYIK